MKRNWAIDHQKARRVKSLLAVGTPKRRVAKQLNLSYSSVDRIAKGIKKQRAKVLFCPGCRHHVLMPCLKCLLEQKSASDAQASARK